MELSEFATHATRLVYLLIALITLADLLQHRDQARLDIALMFLAFGISVGLQELKEGVTDWPVWLHRLESSATMAQPFLLVRLISHFRPLARPVLLGAAAGLVISLAAMWLSPTWPLTGPAVLALVAYFVWAEAYAALAFLRGALATSGVTRWRHTLAAIGSGLVASVILQVGVNIALPAAQPYTAVLNQGASLASGLAFYFAFAPPRWLRHTWQLAELYRFLRALAGRPVQYRANHVLALLADTANRSTGGRAAFVALAAPDGHNLVIQATTSSDIARGSLGIPEGPIGWAFTKRQASLVHHAADMSPEGAQLAHKIGADAALMVPVATVDRRWGVLGVLLQTASLFPDDDLELLKLYAEQAALSLEQAELVSDQEALVRDLRLRTAQLEAANNELEAFSYSVSHDLRAPLRHIEGFTDLLLRGASPPDQQRRHLQRISEAAVRMGRLIDDLLAFSRLGRGELQTRPVQLDQLVDEARRELQADTEGREVEWLVGPLPEVTGDPGLLRLVMVNLLSNAIKYTRGREAARIEVGVAADTNDESVIFVRDNGVGFDMQYANKLFGVFQRLHHTSEFEGVGIGLANVRRIIHRHAGRTWAEGAPNQGATFYFALPKYRPGGAGRAPGRLEPGRKDAPSPEPDGNAPESSLGVAVADRAGQMAND